MAPESPNAKTIAGMAWMLLASSSLTAGPAGRISGVPTNPLPAYFTERVGPEGAVSYSLQTSRCRALFTSGGLIAIQAGDNNRRVLMRFDGSNQGARVTGEGAGALRRIYRSGRAAAESRLFERVRFRELYPGVDVLFTPHAEGFEYDLYLAANVDPASIRIRFEGASVRQLPSGELEVKGEEIWFLQRPPRIFQRGEELSRENVYRLADDGAVTVGVGRHDRAAPLLIDPVVSFSTLVGGSGTDSVYAVAADSGGNLFVAGETSSTDFPALNSTRKDRDVWVMKLDPTGTRILYTTVLSGTYLDSPRGIAVDSMGNAYITGVTTSPDFPVTPGVAGRRGLVEDAFLVKLTPGGVLAYSTYIGGGGSDYGLAVAVDSASSVYVVGQTSSSDFPITSTRFQGTFRGGASDCFVTKVNASGTAWVYSTYLGGIGLDLCRAVAVDASGAAYVAGTTGSADFPLQSPYRSVMVGGMEAFVTKIAASGSALIYSTFVGGLGADDGYGVAVDSSGNAYLTGTTNSSDFPVTPGVVQSRKKGLYDAFVTKIGPAGNSLVYSTFIGGTGDECGTGISVSTANEAIITGYSTSTDLPAVDSVQSGFGGVFDAFVTVIGASGSSLAFSSYLGGTGDDRGLAVVALGNNRFTVAGFSSSPGFPTVNSMRSRVAGYDGFVSQVTYTSLSSPRVPKMLYWEVPTTRQAVAWVMGGPTGTDMQSSNSLQTNPGMRLVGVADFNGDGVPDILWQSDTTGQAQAWYMGYPGTVIQSVGWIVPNPNPWKIVAVCDLNRDGKPDLIWQSPEGYVDAWFMGGEHGDVHVAWASIRASSSGGWNVVACRDFNGDGVPDLVWQAPQGQVDVWYMGGPMGATLTTTGSLRSSPSGGWVISAASDLDGNGQSEVIWQDPSKTMDHVWFLNGLTQTSVIQLLNHGNGGWRLAATN